MIPPPVVLPTPPGTSTAVGSGPDSLVLKVSEQAWNGDAQFTVKVDGAQVGGTFTTKANHSVGISDTVTLKGNWGAGAHKIEVNFTNDAWNGNLLEDRNLYLDGATYNGHAVVSSVVAMLAGGPVTLNVPATAATPPVVPTGTSTTIGAGKDVLVVKVSEQAWNGDAQFTVKVDGVQIGGTLTAKATHALGHSDTFTLKGDWGHTAHKVEVNFINDAWNGNAVEDRNLYVDGMSYNGTAVPSSSVDMKAGGAVSFSVPHSVVSGDASDNVIRGTASADHIKGLGGNDTIRGGAGNDTLEGGDGNDMLDGGTGSDLMIGGTGNDAFVVDDAGDVVLELPGGGYDTVTASVSWTLGANLERLEIIGAATSATGNGLDNTLIGNNSANILNGMAGNDRLQGGGGNDVLIGGLGFDILEGGSGSDSFRFTKPSEGRDTILDFAPRQDFVEISVGGFGGGLSTSTSLASSDRFVLNTTGQATAPAGVGQFIYETDAAKLWWDADGAGAGAATEIATFTAGTSLGFSNMHLIG
jgi:Ca2+-binding RTX toxin-like protein